MYNYIPCPLDFSRLVYNLLKICYLNTYTRSLEQILEVFASFSIQLLLAIKAADHRY